MYAAKHAKPADIKKAYAAAKQTAGTVRDLSKSAWEGLAKVDPRRRLRRYRMNAEIRRTKEMASRLLPAAPKGAVDLRIEGASPGGFQYLTAVNEAGTSKIPPVFDAGSQKTLAARLRQAKNKRGRSVLSEANINRLLDQRREMKVPGGAAPVTIGHHGGRFAGNPAGMEVYGARGGATSKTGRKFTASEISKQQERELRNAKANMTAAQKVQQEKIVQDRLLTAQRKQVVKWWRTGYKKAKVQ
jgi:hypothetical protein